MAILTPSQTTNKSLGVGVHILAAGTLIALLYFGRGFFITLITSAIFAFILDPVVALVMRLRLRRPTASGVVLIVALLGVYLLGVVGWTQLARLSYDLPTYSSRVYEIVDRLSKRLDDWEKQAVDMVVPQSLRQQGQQIEQKPQEAMKARRRRAGLPAVPVPQPIQVVRIQNDPRPAITTLYRYISQYFHALLLASFVPFLVYFMLSWRDHIRKSVLGLFHGEQRYAVAKSWEHVADVTRAYVLGNFILGVFLGIVSAVIFFWLGVPYWPLIGPVSGFLSLVPYVGLPLSILPPLLSALAIPNKFTVLLTITFVTAGLHIFALNFLYPKIVGKRVHLNPLVVTIALLFWGALWGGIGLVLGIPITAAIKAVCDNVESLESFGRLLGD